MLICAAMVRCLTPASAWVLNAVPPGSPVPAIFAKLFRFLVSCIVFTPDFAYVHRLSNISEPVITLGLVCLQLPLEDVYEYL